MACISRGYTYNSPSFSGGYVSLDSAKHQEALATPRFRRLRRFLKIFSLWCLICLGFSFIPDGRRTLELTDVEKFSRPGAVRAGFARKEITPDPKKLGYTVSAYRNKTQPPPVLTPLYVRAAVFSNEKKVDGFIAVVSVECLVIPPGLLDAVHKRLSRAGLSGGRILLAATHTHSGPGNYFPTAIGQQVFGPFNPQWFDKLAEYIASTIRRAHSARRKVRMVWCPVFGGDVIRNRLSKPVDKLHRWTDSEVSAVKFSSPSGKVLGWLVSAGAHALTTKYQGFGGDIPGAISAGLEKHSTGSVAVFLSGAVGGARFSTHARVPKNPDQRLSDQAAADAIGKKLARRILKCEGSTIQKDGLGFIRAEMTLPWANVHPLPASAPWAGVRFLTAPLMRLGSWIAGFWLPKKAPLYGVRIGNVFMLAAPGDVGNALGAEWKRRLHPYHVIPVSHANDYVLGYVEPKAEHNSGWVAGKADALERTLHLYGPNTGPLLTAAFMNMTKQLK